MRRNVPCSIRVRAPVRARARGGAGHGGRGAQAEEARRSDRAHDHPGAHRARPLVVAADTERQLRSHRVRGESGAELVHDVGRHDLRPERLRNSHRYNVKVVAYNVVGHGRPATHAGEAPTTAQNCAYVGPYGNLQGCNLSFADLTGTDLTQADLVGTSLYGAILTAPH